MAKKMHYTLDACDSNKINTMSQVGCYMRYVLNNLAYTLISLGVET